MLEYAVYQWDMNKDALKEAISQDIRLNSCNYDYLVKLVVRHILNGKHRYEPLRNWEWSEDITIVDHGDYQGTLIFLIHRGTDQPSEFEYMLTKVSYGSCNVCDTLQSIQDIIRGSMEKPPSDEQTSDFMQLCLDLTTALVHPFPCPWNNDGWVEKKFI